MTQLKQAKKPPNTRPKNLNLFTIKLPINALVSILHRATGCALFLILPILLGLMHFSLSSEPHYAQVLSILHTPLFKLIILGFSWVFFHHFFAGVRHLMMDVHWMTSLLNARYTSKIVLYMGVIATLIMAVKLWQW